MLCVGEGVAVRRAPGDRAVLARGPRVPRQVPVLLPRRRAERRPPQRGPRRRSLDGRVGRVLLRHEPRFDSDLCADTTNILLFLNQYDLIM